MVAALLIDLASSKTDAVKGNMCQVILQLAL